MQKREANYQDLCQLVEELRSLPEGSTILVEGRKDLNALRKLGIQVPIIQASSSQPLFKLLSGYRQVIILTDYDRRGRNLALRAETTARSFGIAPDLDYRRRIKKATMGEVCHIEGLPTYLSNLRARILEESLSRDGPGH